MRILAVTTMRNEAPFILEWIAYHQRIGVTDFLIYTNDCEDGTDDLLDRLTALGVVRHERNHSGGKKSVQWRALNKAGRHPLLAAADWIYVTDVDEYLCIHTGDGRIEDLITACPNANGFALPWRMFGCNDVAGFVDRPILEQFTRAAPDRLLWPWRAVQFKSLYRNVNHYDRLGVHRPKGGGFDGWVDGNGHGMPEVGGTVVPTLVPRYGLAQINHYAVGSIESFLIKVARGRPNHTGDPIDLAYWMDRNFNAIEDRRILRHQGAVRDNVAALRADPEIVRLHDNGVAWRKARIAELMTQSDSFYLMARLLQSGPTRVLPLSLQKHLFDQLMTVRRLIAEAKS
ncbi:glycosyltransferase family 2 protein [Yoonia sp. 2307UL14-13]|uniref:glycosyltransferase family 2 protein n=1 Tax=Yoonia sp. 2307UL14-13 TaxID=3126506 RepID=UPI0030B24FB0